jgi:hypothetical protein
MKELKNSEVQHIVHIQASKQKGNKNKSDLNLRGELFCNHDETSAAISIELANLCPDSIEFQVNSSAEILRVSSRCYRMHNSFPILIDHYDALHANKVHHA